MHIVRRVQRKYSNHPFSSRKKIWVDKYVEFGRNKDNKNQCSGHLLKPHHVSICALYSVLTSISQCKYSYMYMVVGFVVVVLVLVFCFSRVNFFPWKTVKIIVVNVQN